MWISFYAAWTNARSLIQYLQSKVDITGSISRTTLLKWIHINFSIIININNYELFPHNVWLCNLWNDPINWRANASLLIMRTICNFTANFGFIWKILILIESEKAFMLAYQYPRISLPDALSDESDLLKSSIKAVSTHLRSSALLFYHSSPRRSPGLLRYLRRLTYFHLRFWKDTF